MRQQAPVEFMDEWQQHFAKWPPLPYIMTVGLGRICQVSAFQDKNKPPWQIEDFLPWFGQKSENESVDAAVGTQLRALAAMSLGVGKNGN